jgi:hypothetical protein
VNIVSYSGSARGQHPCSALSLDETADAFPPSPSPKRRLPGSAKLSHARPPAPNLWVNVPDRLGNMGTARVFLKHGNMETWKHGNSYMLSVFPVRKPVTRNQEEKAERPGLRCFSMQKAAEPEPRYLSRKGNRPDAKSRSQNFPNYFRPRNPFLPPPRLCRVFSPCQSSCYISRFGSRYRPVGPASEPKLKTPNEPNSLFNKERQNNLPAQYQPNSAPFPNPTRGPDQL